MLKEVELKSYIGKQIKKYRTERRMTQEDLGVKIGVKNNTISAYERGAASPDSDIFFKLAAALGTRVDDFFPPIGYDIPYLDQMKELNPNALQAKDLRFLQKLIEKTLSLEPEERERFLDSIKFTVEFHEKLKSE